MQRYELVVRERAVFAASEDVTLVRTSVGVDEVHILFDNEEWFEFPITITFAQGSRVYTDPLYVYPFGGSAEWVAEASTVIPHEVIDMVGPIRVTLQGTDSSGRHIITAAGSPLRVEEAGDVVIGDVPADAPTVDQWHQAYADAMAAANEAAVLVATLQGMLRDMVASASMALDDRIADAVAPATTESLGVVQVGEGLSVTEQGVLSAVAEGVTDAQRRRLTNLAGIVDAMTTADIDDSSTFGSVAVKPTALPVATNVTRGAIIADGSTITVDDGGVAHAAAIRYGTIGTVIGIDIYARQAVVMGNEGDGDYLFPTTVNLTADAFAFWGSLRRARFPTCKTVGANAFYECSNLSVLRMPMCEVIGAGAFTRCRAMSDVAFGRVTTVGVGAFEGCTALRHVEFGHYFRALGSSAFLNCTELTTVRFDNALSFGESAFGGCTMLTTVYLSQISQVPSLPSSDWDIFWQTPIGGYSDAAGRYGSIVVPQSLYAAFTTAPGWRQYSSRITTA